MGLIIPHSELQGMSNKAYNAHIVTYIPAVKNEDIDIMVDE